MSSLGESFRYTTDAVFGVDKDMRIRFWNKCCEDIFNISAAQAIGKVCHELIRGNDLLGNPFCCDRCSVIRHHDKLSPKANWDLTIQPPDRNQLVVNVSSYYPDNPDDGDAEQIHVFNSMRTIDCHQLIRRIAFNDQTTKASNIINRLSKREYEIFRMFSLGHKPKTISSQLNVSHATVRNHIKSIYSKLEVHSQAEAINCAMRFGVI